MNKAVRDRWRKFWQIRLTCLLSTGQDASAAFEDVGHSPEARELTNQYRIGTVAGGDPKLPKDIAVSAPPEETR